MDAAREKHGLFQPWPNGRAGLKPIPATGRYHQPTQRLEFTLQRAALDSENALRAATLAIDRTPPLQSRSTQVIYLDHNATTRVLPEVLEAIMPYLTNQWGNPSSAYRFGSKLKLVVETAREQVAALIGAAAHEVVFTSCGTENNNAAIHAALKANPDKRHIVTSPVEHSSVLNLCKALEGRLNVGGASAPRPSGYSATYLPVDRDGLLKVADLENAIRDRTSLAFLMWSNN